MGIELKRVKRILIIHHGEGMGGGLIALIGLIEELKANNRVDVFSIFDSSAIPYIEQTGVKVMLPKSVFYLKFYRLFLHSDASYFNILDFLRNRKNLLTYFLSKYWFAEKELESLSSEYDIVYLNSTFISDWALAAKRLGKKVIIHIREPLSCGLLGIGKAIIRNTIKKNCHSIIAISEDNASRVSLKDKTTVIYDPVVFNGREGDEIITQDENLRYFLYVGGMQRIKGFEQLVQSLRYLNDNVRIYFLGSKYIEPKNLVKRMIFLFMDPYLWRVGSLIRRLEKSKHVIYIGLVDNVFGYYFKSLAVISPFSKPHASLPILEAFSAGKPVIVSNIKGMDELVESGTGFFFMNNNPKELASVINKVSLLSESLYLILSKNAKKKYEKLMEENISVQSVIDSIYNFSNISKQS